MPKSDKTFSVMSTYGLDCNTVVSTILLSPSKRGNAISKPVMYCELTSPAISNVPLCNLPDNLIGRYPLLSTLTPCCGSKSKYAPSVRVKRLPCPTKVTFSPKAAATGIINRIVEPDSIQSRTSLPSLMAEITCWVALISFESIIGSTTPAFAKKEHISALCDTDFDGGTVMSPPSIEFFSNTELILF